MQKFASFLRGCFSRGGMYMSARTHTRGLRVSSGRRSHNGSILRFATVLITRKAVQAAMHATRLLQAAVVFCLFLVCNSACWWRQKGCRNSVGGCQLAMWVSELTIYQPPVATETKWWWIVKESYFLTRGKNAWIHVQSNLLRESNALMMSHIYMQSTVGMKPVALNVGRCWYSAERILRIKHLISRWWEFIIHETSIYITHSRLLFQTLRD